MSRPRSRWSSLRRAVLALSLALPAWAEVSPGQLPQVSFQPGGPAYWERPYFANALMAGGEWNVNWTPVPHWNVAQFDVDGYPQYLEAGQVLTAVINGLHAGYSQRPANWPDLRAIFRGHWVVTWQGHADVRLEGGGLTYLAAESSGPATGSLLNGRRVYRSLDAPEVVRVHAIQAPLTDIKAWLPSPADPQNQSLEGQLFHPVFLQRLAEAPWGLIRFMDWGMTNSSPVQDWSDRRPARHVFATGVLNPRAPAPGFGGNRNTGVAYEHMVALANASQRDLWVTVPHLATDDFVTKLAQLVRYGSDGTNPYVAPQANPIYPPLDPARQVYIEYSNEIWAGGDSFAQGDWAQQQANGLGLSKARFNARRFSQVWRLFQQVFGGSQRLVRVAAVFTAGQFYTQPFLEELAAYGPTLVPPVEPDLVACTTYFGNGIQDWAEQRAIQQRSTADPWFYTPQDFDPGNGLLRPVSVPFGDPYWSSPALERHLQATLAEWRRRMLSGSAAQGGGPDATGLGGGFDVWLRDLSRTVFPTAKPLVAYEGGPSIYTYYLDGGDPRDDGVTTFMEALNRHPGVQQLYAIHLNMAKSKSLRTHSAFVDTSVWGKWGQWGHLEHLQQPLSQAPKHAFLLDWIAEMAGLRHVDDALGQVPEFVTAPLLPPAVYGTPYQADLHSAGGDGARTAEVVGASLVPGLSAALVPGDPGAVRVFGTPQGFGFNHVYVRVADADGDPAWRIFSLYAAGGPGTLFESDFRGDDPGLNTPWMPYYVKTGWLDTYSGWEPGPGAVGQAGDDALVFSVNAPAVESTLAEALADGEHLRLTVLPAAKHGLNLRRAELRFTVERLDYHAPRQYAVFTSVGGFSVGQEVFTTPHFTDQNEPREFVVGLPDLPAYQGLKAPLEIRVYGFAAQYGGHRTSLKAVRLALAPPGGVTRGPGQKASSALEGAPMAGAGAQASRGRTR